MYLLPTNAYKSTTVGCCCCYMNLESIFYVPLKIRIRVILLFYVWVPPQHALQFKSCVSRLITRTNNFQTCLFVYYYIYYCCGRKDNMIAFLNLGIESANHFETNFTRHTVPTLLNAHERTFVAAAAASSVCPLLLVSKDRGSN